MLCATHWAGLLFVSNCLFVFLKYMPAIWEGVLVCLFVCVFLKYLHMHTCIPPMEDCLFFLKYMPGAPCHPLGRFTCLFLFVCLFVFSRSTCIPPMEDLLCTLFLPFFEKIYLFKVVCGLSSALLPAHSCKQHLFPTHSH